MRYPRESPVRADAPGWDGMVGVGPLNRAGQTWRQGLDDRQQGRCTRNRRFTLPTEVAIDFIRCRGIRHEVGINSMFPLSQNRLSAVQDTPDKTGKRVK